MTPPPILDRHEQAGGRITLQSEPARARGPAAVAPPDVVIPPVGTAPTAREVIHAAIARSVRSHLLYLPIARVGEGSEGVHQARVALRRLRSDLRTFGPLLERSWARELAEEARWLGDRLGEVRDADVRIEVLARLVDQEPSIQRHDARALLREMSAERDDAHGDLVDSLDCTRCIELHDRLVEAAGDPQTNPGAEDSAATTLPLLLHRPWRKLRKSVARLTPEPSHADLHRIRIKAKRCRYAAEAVEPVMGKPARRLAKATKKIQGSLGDLNDATAIRAHLATTATEHEELGFVAGELAGLLVARARHRAADFEELWRATDRIKLPKQSTR